MKKIIKDESKYLKALTLQQNLENTLTSATTKGEATNWSFQTFKKVKEKFETKERNGRVRGCNEKKPLSNDNKGIYRLVRLYRIMSKISTDGLLEKKDKMRQEIIHPSVEPKEVEKIIINDIRDDQKSSSPEEGYCNLWTTLTKQLSENRDAEQSAIHMATEVEEYESNNRKMERRLAKEE
ncbi:hypothetical protein C1646_755260 [Rhizophagus diaphanus]|nr:hypothetical protein C1646_755260 [Rhizophagus diaphanus] [Rhizophagus sp. MUCL 43196]